MSHAKQASKRKRRSKALPVLGAAGLSFSLVSGASGGPTVNLPTPNTGASHEITLAEEEISDVSLATFYVFDKETPEHSGPTCNLLEAAAAEAAAAEAAEVAAAAEAAEAAAVAEAAEAAVASVEAAPTVASPEAAGMADMA